MSRFSATYNDASSMLTADWSDENIKDVSKDVRLILTAVGCGSVYRIV